MAEQLDPKELVSFKELLMSEVIQSEAIITLRASSPIICLLSCLPVRACR